MSLNLSPKAEEIVRDHRNMSAFVSKCVVDYTLTPRIKLGDRRLMEDGKGPNWYKWTSNGWIVVE